jgi:hypothetical protein
VRATGCAIIGEHSHNDRSTAVQLLRVARNSQVVCNGFTIRNRRNARCNRLF